MDAKDAKRDKLSKPKQVKSHLVEGVFFFKLFFVGSFCSAETRSQKRKPMGTGVLMKDREGHIILLSFW